MWALSLRPLKEEDVSTGTGRGRAHARDTAAGNGAPKAENLLSEEQWLGPGPIIMQARLRALHVRDVLVVVLFSFRLLSARVSSASVRAAARNRVLLIVSV